MNQTRTAETAQEMWDYIHSVGGTLVDIQLLMSETKHAYFLYEYTATGGAAVVAAVNE